MCTCYGSVTVVTLVFEQHCTVSYTSVLVGLKIGQNIRVIDGGKVVFKQWFF